MIRRNHTSRLLIALTLTTSVARAQSSFLMPDDVNASEGLQSATPSDNVNELNENGGAAPDNGAGFDNFENSPATQGANEFNINAEAEAGDNLFGDGGPATPANNNNSGAGVDSVSAFGNDIPVNANTAPANKPAVGNANPAAVNNVPVSNLPVNDVPVNTVPVNSIPLNSPANAQSLMNSITAPGNAAPANSGVAPVPGSVVPAGPSEPAITAPALPSPNEFAGAPPVPGTQRIMAEGEAPEEYRVQPGDTLFDICDQLLDEPGYWPKLWALNPEIKNPHFIFPNMRLRFFPGDDETPPYLQVVTEDDVIPIDKGDLDEQELVAEKVDFSEEVFADDEIVEVIGPDQVEPGEGDLLELSGRTYQGGDIQVQVPGFIFGEEREALAYVLGGREGEVSLSQDQQALLENAGGIAAGTTYTVLRKGEKVENPETGDFVGHLYYFVANIKVDRSVENDVFTGTVQASRLSVRADDIIVSFISTNRSIPSGEGIGSLASAKANVVGFEYPSQDLGGQGHYAFIDAGNGDGVAPGMYVAVYSTPGGLSLTFRDANLPQDYEYVGVMRIIDVTDAGAVGFIVKNVKELRIGDRVGKG